MTNRLRARLERTFGALIAVATFGIGVAVALIALSVQVRTLSIARDDTTRMVDEIVAGYPTSRDDAPARVRLIMSHLPPSTFMIVLNDGRLRYEGRWVAPQPGSGKAYAISVHPRGAFLDPAHQLPFVDHASRSLAGLVGYNSTFTHDGNATIAVLPGTVDFKLIAWRSLLVLIGSIPLALIAGYVLGTALSYQALVPLVLVSEALEAFAAGDLTPRPVRTRPGDADERDRLALAYNAAMATMSRAFAERARAEATMRQFISDASHQLRTPLTVLRGFTGILRRREFDTDQEFAHIIDTMDGQSAIMMSLLQKLILLEAWEVGPPSTHDVIDIGEAVEHVVGPIAESHGHRDVRLHLGVDAFASIDPEELHHALGNLVTNALNYAPEGTITVQVSLVGDDVHISVEDQGPGMTEDEIRFACDRFYRGARRDVAGSGLGLAIAKRAVERANGALTIESTLGKGTRFTIALPRAVRRDAPPVELRPTLSPSAPGVALEPTTL